jgi:hypothetical protein
MINPNCDGSHCTNSKGEVRLYPLGGGGNLILCASCWNYENAYRARQAKAFGPENWPQVNWDSAKGASHHPDCPATDGFGCRCNGEEMAS